MDLNASLYELPSEQHLDGMRDLYDLSSELLHFVILQLLCLWHYLVAKPIPFRDENYLFGVYRVNPSFDPLLNVLDLFHEIHDFSDEQILHLRLSYGLNNE